MVERSLPTPEARGSNPVIGKFNMYILSTVLTVVTTFRCVTFRVLTISLPITYWQLPYKFCFNCSATHVTSQVLKPKTVNKRIGGATSLPVSHWCSLTNTFHPFTIWSLKGHRKTCSSESFIKLFFKAAKNRLKMYRLETNVTCIRIVLRDQLFEVVYRWPWIDEAACVLLRGRRDVRDLEQVCR